MPRRQTRSGWTRRDTSDLYELLIDPADTDGVPALSDSDANVWASISASEGHLKAVNTYDTAFVSVGPIQQTVGARNYKGELPGALAAAKSEAPGAYEQHLGRHGLDIADPAMELGARKAFFELEGTVRESPDQKHPLRDFIWAYRLAETVGDPDMREPMLREGFSRLERIRGREITFDVEVSGTTHTIESTLGEIFRTDLAQALLLDAHVNLPALVWSQNDDISIAIGAAQEAFTAQGITTPSIMTREQDLLLVAALMEARLPDPRALNMSDPVGRAIGILKYTDTDVVEDLAEVEGYSGPNAVPLYLNEELNVADADDTWTVIQSYPRKVLSLRQP